MKKVNQITFSLFIVLLNACNHKANMNNNLNNCVQLEQEVYKSQIVAITDKVVDLTVPQDLLLQPDFINLYENPLCNIDNSKDFLLDSTISTVTKQIIVVSLFNIEKKYFYNLTGFLYQGVKCKKIDESVLKAYLLISLIEKPLIIKYKNDKEFKKFIQIMIDEKYLSKDFLDKLKR